MVVISALLSTVKCIRKRSGRLLAGARVAARTSGHAQRWGKDIASWRASPNVAILRGPPVSGRVHIGLGWDACE
jgi:hypothetical protein